jgi:hypothetical protein
MRCYRDTISLIKLAESRQPKPLTCPRVASLLPHEYPQVVSEVDYSKIKGIPFELQGPFDHRSSPDKADSRLEDRSDDCPRLRQALSEQAMAKLQTMQRTNSVDWKKGLSRAQVKSFLNVVPSEGRFARSYNPNYKTVEKRLDQLCLPFGKAVGRDFTLKYQGTSPYSEVLDHLVKNQGRRMLHRR